MNQDSINFINKLHNSMADYQPRASKDANVVVKKESIFKRISFLLHGCFDMIILLFRLNSIRKNKTSIYYTHTSFIRQNQNNFEDILYKELFTKNNLIIISYDRYNYYKRISNFKVYNLGNVVRILQKISIIERKTNQFNLNNWLFVNEIICKKLNGNDVYIPAYSNETGFSLVFNRYRKNFKLIEIQHGSVINYPPYSFVSEMPLVDTFYYRNESSKLFLEKNLFAKIAVTLKPLKPETSNFLPSTSRTEMLYISSYEYDMIHPVFEEFLRNKPDNCFVKIRLHPRQLPLEENFKKKLTELNCNFEIDKSKMWYSTIPYNTIVVSPLSSVLEEAVNFKLKTIIIDNVGAKRYDYLIDNKICFYSSNIMKLLKDQEF